MSAEDFTLLNDEQKRSVEHALDGLDLYDEELEVTLFASEPMMVNPTNMDIDDRGRVWICEGYNYRNKLNPRNPYSQEGDRILIMEDTDGDGKADTSKVFYQGEDINSALGIAVLGDRVIVSCSPNVFVFTDANGDDVPEKKEILFQGIGGEQHDHGMHAFTFGADGKLYFNYGNAGNGLLTRNGESLKDKLGRTIHSDTQPYQEGMVFRCNPDGSNVEILGWNFRNNYELAVDSYGRMWQSDNDDDGNRGTRINYVMDYGNYGFKDEITRADWRTRRVNMEDSVFHQHWHLNDPGVVPNLLQTFAGSPTGIIVYEGELLPEKYRNQIIHCDAGPNIVRAYPAKEQGAGFTAEIIPILDGNNRDKWFRPSDVCVAPDGSIFVSDWYDPGVGGHAMGDTERGRVYRIAPKGHKYQINPAKYSSPEEATFAIQNPNVAVRYKAYQALKKMGESAKPALEELYASRNSRMRSRAFYLLAALDAKYIERASKEEDEGIRVAAVRAARMYIPDAKDFFLQASKDNSFQVKREVCLAIRHKEMPEVWLELAKAFDGKDRWYLEALGIGADGNWDVYLSKLLEEKGQNWWNEPALRDLVWRSRASNSAELIGQVLANLKAEEKPKFYRALDFQPAQAKNEILLSRLKIVQDEAEQITILRQMDKQNGAMGQEMVSLAKSLLSKVKNTEDKLEIVQKYKLKEAEKEVLDIVLFHEDGKLAGKAAKAYWNIFGIGAVKEKMLDKDLKKSLLATERFGLVDENPITDLLISMFNNASLPLELRKKAMEAMNGWKSEELLWDLLQKNKIPKEVMDIAKNHMLRTWHSDIREAATKLWGSESENKYDIKKLLVQKGDVQKGEKVYTTYCSVCHVVNGEGVNFGPQLSQIGAKLSKEGLYNAIINPSEGMGFGYETQLIKKKNGEEILCIINSKTENELIVKMVGQADQTKIARNEIASVVQQETSLMPKFPLAEEELVNLVSYLGALK